MRGLKFSNEFQKRGFQIILKNRGELVKRGGDVFQGVLLTCGDGLTCVQNGFEKIKVITISMGFFSLFTPVTAEVLFALIQQVFLK